MASTLKLNTLTGASTAGSIAVTGEGNSTTTNLQQGLVKSWVNFDGTASGATARDSFNVSGMTDNATGDYTAAFSNSMANANYSAMVACGDTGGTKSTRDEEILAIATGSVRLHIFHTNDEADRDEAYVGGLVVGDLA